MVPSAVIKVCGIGPVSVSQENAEEPARVSPARKLALEGASPLYLLSF